MSELRNIISKTPELLSALDDVNVLFVSIAGTGRFEYVKLGRRRKGSVSVAEAEMRQLAALLKSGQHVEGEWVARMFGGVGPGAILIERRPVAIVERLAQNVLNALRLSVKREGDGVVIGPPGASKSSVLLWLSTQITDEAVLFVSENPPAELPGAHVTHVFPPNADTARDFERLLRVSPVVFWDRIRDLKDLQTLSACFGRKWFSLDRSTPESSASFFESAKAAGVMLDLATVLALSVSVIGRPEVRSFAFKESMGWNNLHGPDALSWVEGTVKSADPTELLEAPKLESSLEEKSAGAGIRKRPGHPTMDFDNPLTVPVDALEEISSVDPPSVPEITRQYPHTPLPEPFSSGPHRPLERSKFQPDAATSSASNDILERIMPMLRDEPMPEVNLEDLRITMHEDVDPDDLDVSREQDTASHRAAEFDLREYADEYHERMKDQDFPDVTGEVMDLDDDNDDDYEDDFGNDFSQISEVIHDDLAEILTEDEIATSVASATDYALNSWQRKNFSPDPETSPTGRFSDPIELESIQDVEREDATEEVNLNDKLKLIRERFQRKD